MTLPGIPVDTVSIRGVFAEMIQAVQVGEVTGLVPPGSLVQCGTVAGIGVVVSIFSGECHAAMVGKGVTSSSYRNTIREMHDIKKCQNKLMQHYHGIYLSKMLIKSVYEYLKL